MPEKQDSTLALPQAGAQTAAPGPDSSSPGGGKPRTAPLNQTYALPVPIRTFPLPSFYPNNPLSILQFAWAWASQVLFPPPAEPSAVWDGIWSPESRSIHVVDQKAIRALWEQGFYGKGNLSRSEPNWLKREKVRRGLVKSHVSEEMTTARREERNKMKWERARAEQEAIRQIRLEEARQASALSGLSSNESQTAPVSKAWEPPVGPAQLLALPNSLAELLVTSSGTGAVVNGISTIGADQMDTPIATSHATAAIPNGTSHLANDTTTEDGVTKAPAGLSESNGSGSEPKTLKRSKSVRFSPKVESATFQRTDPPSPSHGLLNDKPVNGTASGEAGESGSDTGVPRLATATTNGEGANGIGGSLLGETVSETAPDEDILDKEHLQLIAEEAFFLSFGLGALRVLDPVTRVPMDTVALFKLFRQYSTFPAQSEQDLMPDDGFLVNYAVYHHFRSLGWVPRPGIKFATDWMLYAKGPVFDHAEFGLVVLPSFSDPWWEANGRPAPTRSWTWLHGVLRVLAHVQKSLVLVYVDIPPPPTFNEAHAVGVAEVLKLYKIREVMIRRWSANRNR